MNAMHAPILADAAGRIEEQLRFEFLGLPEGWLAVGGLVLLAALVWSVVWMYRHEGRAGASVQRRTLLAALRAAVILALAAIWLEPVMARYLHRWIDSYTLVLVDTSASMDLSDAYRDATLTERAGQVLGAAPHAPVRRFDLARQIIEGHDHAFLRALTERNRVRVYTFDESPALRHTVRRAGEQLPKSGAPSTASTVAAAEVRLDAAAQGPSTHVERAVRRALESHVDTPVAGVIVISDGRFTEGADAEAVARLAQDRDVPIFTIGIGDPSPPRNVRVADVLAPQSAFQKDPFTVTARLAAEGAGGTSLRVDLRERADGEPGDGRVVASKSVGIGEDGRIEPISFELRRTEVGRYVYRVEVPVQEFESVADDNARQVSVQVIDARVRVLIVSGQPSREYQFLHRLLARDESFSVSCWLQSADVAAVRDGNVIIDHLPATVEELFEYDAILLLDPDPSELTQAWCELVDRLVSEHGGGLLYAAARPYAPDFMHAGEVEPILGLLPVALDPEADLVLNRVGHYQTRGAPVIVAPESATHPILRLGLDPAATRDAWQADPVVYWHYPVLRPKPVATVLLRTGQSLMQNSYGQHVLAAVQFVGAGRAAFLGFDGTWRWRRMGEERYNRFWVQLVRYLVEGKLLGGRKRGQISTEADEFPLGEAVNVSARLYDAGFEPLSADRVEASYSVDDDRRSLALDRRLDQPGWFEGRFLPHRTGSYRIGLTLPSSSGPPVEVSCEIRVTRPNIEIVRPQMDRQALVTLARGSGGGRYFEMDEAMQVPPLISDRHEVTTTRSRPIVLWDRWWTLALLVTLLTVEWGVRKWSRLL